MRYCSLLLVPALFNLLASCALHSHLAPANQPLSDELNHVLSGAALFNQQPIQADFAPPPLLGVNDEMRAFLDQHIPRSKSPHYKLRKLLSAIAATDAKGFNYQPLKNHNATEAFLYREGNCLSFTSMFISLARERGINIAFNEVDIPAVWDQLSDTTYIYYRHINAIARIQREKYVVDVNMANYNQAYPQRKISDQLAAAHYYNNSAMHYLFADNIPAAFNYLRNAIALAPDMADLWSNLGTLYRRKGKFAEARIAYQHSLELDAGKGIAASNLGHMYTQMGNQVEAEKYSNLARVFRLKNPYYQYHLAKSAYAEQNIDKALRHIKAAMKLHNKDHRFFSLAASINQALGNTRAANSLLKKADALKAQHTPASNNGATTRGLPPHDLAL